MRNKQIFDSWHKVQPSAVAETRMLASILARSHQGSRAENRMLTKHNLLTWRRFVPVAAFLALGVVLTVSFLRQDSDEFPLALSDRGVNVSYANKVPAVSVSGSLVFLTEDELLADAYDGRPIAIFAGAITEVKNIRLDFGDGSDDYRAIAKIKVSEVLRGDMAPGVVISMLLPAPVGVDGVRVSGTGTSSQMVAGVTGIFTPIKYDETSVREQNGVKLHLLDLAEYGLLDGERWAFLETANGLVYLREAYPSLAGAENLHDVQAFLRSRLK